MLPKLFVIIVTYKGHQWYRRCFTSLRGSELPIQIIVVDNASNDGTVEYICENFPEIHLIESKENLGFGRANNIGMRYALDHGCDYVFLLNQDAWLDASDTLARLVDIYKNHPEYGILSPMHLNIRKDGLVMEYFCHRPDNKKLIEDLYLNQLTDIYDTRYIHAAAWMLSRNTLETIGGFNPIFYHYEEDGDYLNRVIYHGLKIGVCPASRIIHDHHSRTPVGEQIKLREKQLKIYEYVNLNKPFNSISYMFYYIRKWLVSTLKGNFRSAQRYSSEITFLVKMKNKIVENRRINQQIGPKWL